MKLIDKILQRWRMSIAFRFIPARSRLLDIGCFNGELFKYAGSRLRSGLGIDPAKSADYSIVADVGFILVKGFFPADIPPETEKFDVITVLAVLEHIPEENLADFVEACYDWLNSGGKVILTVPSPFVDKILAVLLKLRLIDGMSLDEHHGFSLGDIPGLFEGANFALIKHSTFQLGLNNLFIFEKPDGEQNDN